MQINRLVFPGFWFDRQDISFAEELARLGVGGFCLYGGSLAQIKQFTQRVRRASPLEKILICADYEDGLGRWVKDAPRLAPNLALGAAGDENLAGLIRRGLGPRAGGLVLILYALWLAFLLYLLLRGVIQGLCYNRVREKIVHLRKLQE